MTEQGLPIRAGDTGAAVRDLHRRLAAVGFAPNGEGEHFDADTVRAVRSFQASRGLIEDGVVSRQTWAALVEADYRLGDRMLYLRSPMTRGDDVTDLQQRLGSLGFDAGYVDGIFGPDTERALRDFQANQGVTPDGVAGPDSVTALGRLAGRRSGEKTIAEVREAELLRHQHGLHGRRLIVGETGGIAGLVDMLARRLRSDGADVLTLHHPDLSHQARTANEWDGAVYVGVALAVDDLSVGFFQTDGFVSYGGRGLAAQTSTALETALSQPHRAIGMRLPILRETRMPAVWCRLGQPADVVERAPALAVALQAALTTWCETPEHLFE
ncbi:MAG: peptidoglycan-binding protein [Actinomycetota bacterium]